MYLSFIVPCYNEQDSLRQLYDEVVTAAGNHLWELIFVDDGSSDSSPAIMADLAHSDHRVKVIGFRRNFGKATALQAGFDAAVGEVVVTMDADLQDDPAELPKLLGKLDDGYDIVSGWKKKRHDPPHKRWPSKLFNYTAGLMFGLRLHDYNCGYKAYRREAAHALDLYGEMHRFVPALAHARGFKVGEVAVNHRARPFGHSKYGFKRYFRGFWDLLTVVMVTGFTSSPLHFFGGIGTFLGLAGFFVSLYLTAMKIFCHAALSNRPLLFLGVLLIITGLQFFSVGLMGELLVNATRDRTRRPSATIKEKINL